MDWLNAYKHFLINLLFSKTLANFVSKNFKTFAMKKLIVLLVAPLLFSCASYEPVTIVDETDMYDSRRADNKIATIPGNTVVQMSGKKNVRKVNYRGSEGYVLKPNYASHITVQKVKPKK